MTDESTSKFRVLVFGTGAIGTYIGGSLLLSGAEVVFLETPAVAERISRDGLVLTLPDATHYLRNINVVTSIENALAVGEYMLGIVAVKSFDTAGLSQSLIPFKESLPPILSLQNGVENEEVLATGLGSENVLFGTLTSAIGKTDTGKVSLEKLRGIGIATTHPLVPVIIQQFNQAGLNARAYPNSAGMKWSKMLTNLLANATSAILDMSPREIYSHPGLCRLEILQIREALAVMKALKIPVVDLPGTPVRLLAWGISRLPLTLVQPFLKWKVGVGRGGKMPSFHIDLMNKRGKSEVDYLNGAVVRFGERAGIAAPVNQLLNQTLLALTNGLLNHADFQHKPEKLLSHLPSRDRIG